MNLRVTPNFNAKITAMTPQNKSNRSVNFHSQPIADTVNFGANPTTFVHNSFASKLLSEEAFRAFLTKHKDIFNKVGEFKRVGEHYFIEDKWTISGFSRSDDELRAMLDKYTQKRDNSYFDIVKHADVGTVDEPVLTVNGSTGFNNFIKDLLNWKEDFPLIAVGETDGHYAPELAFHPDFLDKLHVLTGYINESGAEFLKETNPNLAAYLNEWNSGDLGNIIEHKGKSYVISPIEAYISGEFITTGIRYAPVTPIK